MTNEDAALEKSRALTTTRGATHGDWHDQAGLAQRLKFTVRESLTAKVLPHQVEAIEMILVKISRIVSGNPSEPDHWDDIAGYAFLGKGGHKK